MPTLDPTGATAVRARTSLVVAGVVLVVGTIGGCAHQLRGKVLPSDRETIIFLVDADSREWADAQSADGIPGARVRLQLDPTRINRRMLAETTTGPEGSFTLNVSEFGAGVLEYDVALEARLAGHQSAVSYLTLPPSSARVIIYLTSGEDTPQITDPDDIEGDIERFWR